jgi:hypothetical protein
MYSINPLFRTLLFHGFWGIIYIYNIYSNMGLYMYKYSSMYGSIFTLSPDSYGDLSERVFKAEQQMLERDLVLVFFWLDSLTNK